MPTPSELFATLAPAGCAYTFERCEVLAPLINEINALKKEKNAVILAHSYVSPEISFCVADFTGDSYQLANDAKKTDADIIVFAAVRFMAEGAKLLSPDKMVLLPATDGGCTLADSITADDVHHLRAEHPDYTFVCYINTTAEVKAVCDVCVTSSNVVDIIARIPNDNIYFLPDRLMGANVAADLAKRGIQKNLKWWTGTCYVHEDYDANAVGAIRRRHPEVEILAHPECSPGVVYHADFTGSTNQLLGHMRASKTDTFLLLTECGLAERMRVEMPEKKFVGSCQLCRFMKSNTLEGILRVLRDPRPADIIDVDPAVAAGARRCLDAMFSYAELTPAA